MGLIRAKKIHLPLLAWASTLLALRGTAFLRYPFPQAYGSRRGPTCHRKKLLRSSGAGVAAGDAPQLSEQPFKVVTVRAHEESGSQIPWKALGDVLFEMGAPCVSVPCGEEDDAHMMLEEGLSVHGRHGLGGLEAADGGATMLALTFEGGRDVQAALEAACAMVGPGDCVDALDWEEGPVECLESWEAASSSSGFETVQLHRLQVIPVQRGGEAREGTKQMKLLEGQGWGDGQHPSTWMCLDFLEKVIQGGEEEVIDYGTGSGVLATAAALLGANHVSAVDVDVEILTHARQNFRINGVDDKVSAMHTRDVSIGDLSGEVVVVNMLAGPMRRLMPILVLAVKPGGYLCLSGLRPSDIPDIKRCFGGYLNWTDELEITRTSTAGDEWVRIVGRPKAGLAPGGALRDGLEREFSDVAIS